jgi:molybdate transport system ATP-binding protein
VPIVYVTHAIEEIVRLADAVVVMAAGSVIANGKVSEVMGRRSCAPTPGASRAAA